MDAQQNLASESVDFCLEKLALYQKISKGLGVSTTRVVGTAVLRCAQNAETFSTRAERILGQPVEVLPEGEESAYVYLASHDLREPPDGGLRLVLDVGGGSTEIAIGDAQRLIEVFSIPEGAARLARRFLRGTEPRSVETVRICEYLHQNLDLSPVRTLLDGRPAVLLACGSTATGVGALEAGVAAPGKPPIRGLDVSLEAMLGWLEAMVELSPEERGQVEGLEAERGDVMLAGLALWIFLLEKLDLSGMVVSDFGLRHGVLREILGADRAIL
jgi:exopolyphosphatase/guanosine-5'-triphosphate,3'-diphosphate pyrophosphatase